MLFNSIDFAIFLPIVFIIYWFIVNKNIRYQNLFILVSSYLFYGWWDYRFLSLIFFSSILDYSIGLTISKIKTPLKKKLLLIFSIVFNIGLLGFFKYYDFFVENFIATYSFFGRNLELDSLNIILPVGISFYTFQTLSYSIDVYRGRLSPTKDFIAFSAFVSFFPQLVAGPIERATNLLPQFYKRRHFNYENATDGLRQILWGLFKKVVIADNCAEIANYIFNNSADLNGSTLFFGAVFFSFQIYGDFSGYSDIAIGTSKLFGFSLMQNFAFPYFSRDIAEFWRRWHISLTTWFRDYIYIPLGGSRVSNVKKIRNTFIIFIISGFWHGANWTFIIWGLLHALIFLPLLLQNKNRRNIEINMNSSVKYFIIEILQISKTFLLTTLAWIFFRARDIDHALSYLKAIFSKSIIQIPHFENPYKTATLLLLIVCFILVEWFGKKNNHALETIGLKWPLFVRWGFYSFIFLLMIFFAGNKQEFIYFQF